MPVTRRGPHAPCELDLASLPPSISVAHVCDSLRVCGTRNPGYGARDALTMKQLCRKHPPLALLSRAAILIGLVAAPVAARALDLVTLVDGSRRVHVDGEVLLTAADGGLLVQGRDGRMWTVEPEHLVAHRRDDEPFAPLSAEELVGRIREELSGDFDVFTTGHYVIVHNTSRSYAQWCGSLFERLYMAFTNYWRRQGFELVEPRFPLVALVFADAASYRAHAAAELGESAPYIVGYYSLQSNRITTYDLTGLESLRRRDGPRTTAAQVNALLSQPAAEQMVATLIHEATHQIAFNCGLHQRYADIPLWVSEGLAVYFETPDLSSRTGWRTIGAVNHARLDRFRDYLRRRPDDSLRTLLADDARMRDPQTAIDAYAEAWALNYFLLRQRSDPYLKYLSKLSAKTPLAWSEPAERLEEFRAALGTDLEQLDEDFLRFISRLR